jgi:sulfotransferase
MSSPVGGLFQRLLAGINAPSGFSIGMTPTQRADILRGIFDLYYKEIHTEKTVFDTSRLWCSKMAAIAHLFPDAKVIVCVRELAWIMDSFERIMGKSPLVTSKMFKPREAATIYTRVNALASGNGVVGFAWNAVQEALYGEHANRLIVVDYEALARDPRRVTALLYEHLKLPAFEHDFDNVAFEAGEAFDNQIGIPGLHTVARQVKFSQRPTILPPDLFERFSGRNFWRRRAAQSREVPILLPSAVRPQTLLPGGLRQQSMESHRQPEGA